MRPGDGRGPSRGGSPLRAVVFDLDGTLADTERDGHRVAFNRAFERSGLPDRWDEDLYGELLWVAGGRDRLAHYFTKHRPLPEDERDRLAGQIHALKNRLFLDLIGEGAVEARPGAARLLLELQQRSLATAIATGGTRSWVEPLLDHLFGERITAGLGAVVTHDDVENAKPHPEMFLTALDRLECPAHAAVAVEDAENGLRAAKAAAMACVVVPNGYTMDHDFSSADLVLAGFGEPEAPAAVLHDPHDLRPPGVLDADVLARLLLVTGGSARAESRHGPAAGTARAG